MDVSIYNKQWIVPAKCGSRYLDELFGVESQYNSQLNGVVCGTPQHHQWMDEVSNGGFTKIAVQSTSLQHYSFLPITHIVLRSPLSQLYSALHTDLWAHSGYWVAGMDNRVGIDEIEDVNPNFLETLLKYITTGTGHYSPTLYKNIWYLLQSKGDIEIVPLNRLSEFSSSYNPKMVYHSDNYNWEVVSTDITREELIGYIERTYPTIWKRITDLHSLDMGYYNSLNVHHTYPKVHPFTLKKKLTKPYLI